MARNASKARAASPGAVNGLVDQFDPHNPEQENWPKDPADDRPLTIGEVAQQYGITLRALRFYEAKRLITPHRHGATRLYRLSDRKRLSLILTGRRLGFTLAEIKHLLNRPHDGGLHLTREQCVKQIKLLEQQKRSIETAITELRQIHTSFYRRLVEEAGEHSH
ncbi:MAG: MerR family transcriptional regulator [Xanthobacteraceae bacterium]